MNPFACGDSAAIDTTIDTTVDRSVLMELYVEVAGNDNEIMLELIDTFLKDSRRHLQEMPQVVADGQMSALEINAHSLRSTFATFGAFPLSRAVGEIEQAARNGKAHNLQEKVDRVMSAFREVENLIEAERQRYSAGAAPRQ